MIREKKSFTKENLKNGEPVIIYGACIGGELALEGLKNIGITPKFFCDGLKKSEMYCGIPVISPSQLKEYPNAHILIAATRGFQAISEYLDKIGCKKQYDICDVLKYIDESSVKKYPRALSKEHIIETYRFYAKQALNKEEKSIDLLFINFVITERCSLKCEKCIELMPYYKEPKNYEVEDIRKPLKRLFECIDSLEELQIVGGEPFMNKNLYKIIDLVKDNNKIKKITVVSNGTIIPNQDNVKVLKNEKVKLILDNYGDISKNISELEKIALNEGINYCVQVPDIWQDCGELKERDYDMEKVKSMFKDCTQRYCMTFLKGKLYRCAYSAHSINLKATPNEKSDYVDFNDNTLDDERIRIQLKKLMSEKEYLSACYYCSGINPNLQGIKPAKQVKDPIKYTVID